MNDITLNWISSELCILIFVASNAARTVKGIAKKKKQKRIYDQISSLHLFHFLAAWL